MDRSGVPVYLGAALLNLSSEDRQQFNLQSLEHRNGFADGLSVTFCLLLAVSMILNTQMGGEGVWFWYATFFHQGSRIYSDFHLPLQPLVILETDGWMRLLGTKCWQYEIPSVFHALALWAAFRWMLKFTEWPRATRAALNTVAFCIAVVGSSYRFDDYHVISETCIVAGIAALLEVGRAETTRRIMIFSALGGMFAALALMTRLNDGAAMAVTAAFCLLVMAKRQRVLAAVLFLASTAATVLIVVMLTRDPVSAWMSNSVMHAAASKGGAGGFWKTPFILLWRWWGMIWFRLGILASAVFLTWGTRWAAKRWGLGTWFLICARVAVLLGSIFLLTDDFRDSVIRGRMLDTAILLGIYLTYAAGGLVLLRWAGFCRKKYPWNPLEVLLLIPLSQWVSMSMSSSGDPLMQFYCQLSMFLLLLAVLVPAARVSFAVRQEIFVWAVCLSIFACVNKAWVPYSWQNWVYSPMFTHRTWYHHPIRGPLYIDRDLLAFSQSSCGAVEAGETDPSKAELLALPYPYPNYFCGTPPWHGYIQTYFDTTQRFVVEDLIKELQQSPPKWIIYQRQLTILAGAEGLYNHGQPLAQRDLDTLLMEKIKSGQWKLVEWRNYLPGDGWYVIQTHP